MDTFTKILLALMAAGVVVALALAIVLIVRWRRQLCRGAAAAARTTTTAAAATHAAAAPAASNIWGWLHGADLPMPASGDRNWVPEMEWREKKINQRRVAVAAVVFGVCMLGGAGLTDIPFIDVIPFGWILLPTLAGGVIYTMGVAVLNQSFGSFSVAAVLLGILLVLILVGRILDPFVPDGDTIEGVREGIDLSKNPS